MFVMMSINPKYSGQILNGTKLVEFRKTLPTREINGIFIYETAPTSKVVGFAYVDMVMKGTVDFLWELYGKVGGISFYDLQKYAKNKPLYGIVLEKVERFKEPLELSDFGINSAPQSWVYIYPQLMKVSDVGFSAIMERMRRTNTLRLE